MLQSARYYAGDKRPITNDEIGHLYTTMRRFQYVPNKNEMPKSNDIGKVKTRIMPGCKIDPFAAYVLAPHRVIINLELWRAASTQTQAALIAHEIYYHLYRSSNSPIFRDTTSENARELVPILFSQKLGAPLNEGTDKAVLRCSGGYLYNSHGKTKTAATSFFVIEEGNKFHLQFDRMIDKPLTARTRFTFSKSQFPQLDLKKTKWQTGGMAPTQSGVNLTAWAKIESPLNRDFALGIRFVSNQVVKFQFKNRRTGASYIQDLFLCRPTSR